MSEAANGDERGWAMAAHLCGLLWVLGSGGTPYRLSFCLRLVK